MAEASRMQRALEHCQRPAELQVGSEKEGSVEERLIMYRVIYQVYKAYVRPVWAALQNMDSI